MPNAAVTAMTTPGIATSIALDVPQAGGSGAGAGCLVPAARGGVGTRDRGDGCGCRGICTADGAAAMRGAVTAAGATLAGSRGTLAAVRGESDAASFCSVGVAIAAAGRCSCAT